VASCPGIRARRTTAPSPATLGINIPRASQYLRGRARTRKWCKRQIHGQQKVALLLADGAHGLCGAIHAQGNCLGGRMPRAIKNHLVSKESCGSFHRPRCCRTISFCSTAQRPQDQRHAAEAAEAGDLQVSRSKLTGDLRKLLCLPRTHSYLSQSAVQKCDRNSARLERTICWG